MHDNQITESDLVDWKRTTWKAYAANTIERDGTKYRLRLEVNYMGRYQVIINEIKGDYARTLYSGTKIGDAIKRYNDA